MAQGQLSFKGSTHFRQRLCCSLLSGRPITITQIRSTNEAPGLRDFEASFLRLLDKVTNGTSVVINETGTEVRFKPGMLVGGKVQHPCPPSRAVSYHVEGLLHLAPFMKEGLRVTFTGVTNAQEDCSVDILRTVTMPLLERFGARSLALKVLKRGAPPLGGGEVLFTAGVVRELRAQQIVDEGQIAKVRGIAYSTRVSPQISNRLMEASKTYLQRFTPHVQIHTDHYKGQESGKSPGFGLALIAESNTGARISAECVGAAGELPEDVGVRAAKMLLEEIYKGGVVDTSNQTLPLLYMVLCPEDVSKLRLGHLSDYSVKYLRILRQFFGVKFKIVCDTDAESQSESVLLSCQGIGFVNFARKIF